MFLDLLRKRRSTRQFTSQPVEVEKINILLEAALRAPSSKTNTPWEFIVIEDPKVIVQLSTAKPHGASFLKKAPLAIAVCGNTEKSDVWIEDCAIAALLVQLQAADIGLGSCWIQLRLRPHDEQINAQDFAAGVLGLPAGIQVLAMIAIGYPAEEKKGRSFDSLHFSQVHRERFGQTY